MPAPLTLEEMRAHAEAVLGAMNARDFDALRAMPFYDEERSEFNSAFAAAGSRTYRGIDGLREWAREVDEISLGFRTDLLRVVQAGDNQMASECHVTATARGSGIPIDSHTGQLWTWNGDGVAIRVDSFSDPRIAFEAAGVPFDS